MLFGQVGLGGVVVAVPYAVIALFATMFSFAGLASGLIAFAVSFAWRRLPGLDTVFAVGAVVCLVCYLVIWITWGQMPTDWPFLLAAFAGPIVGGIAAWVSHRRRSYLFKEFDNLGRPRGLK